MLIAFSEKITGWLATVIVSLLIISFALWGINFYLTPDQARNIAKVGDQPIPIQDYQRALYNQRQQIKLLLGDNAASIDDTFIQKQTLKQLIDAELINQAAYDEGLQMSDDSIRNAIENTQAFQSKDGIFDRVVYKTSLLNYGIEPAYFEEKIRLDMLSEQLKNAVAKSAFITDREIELVIKARQQRRTIFYTIFSSSSYLERIEVNEQDIEEFYNTHTQRYMEPEQVKIAFIELNMQQLLTEMQFEEEDLRAYYDENKDQFTLEEKRNVKQLTIKLAEDATTTQRTAAKKSIEKAKEQLDKGRSMEEIVETYSKEGASNLDFSEQRAVTPGIMPAEIDAFLFTAAEGDVSGLIETEKGLHIVQLDSIEKASEGSYEDVREKVLEEYRHAQAEAQFFERLDTLATLSYEHQDTLHPAASTTGLKIQESDFFSKQDKKEGVLARQQIIDAAFSNEIKNNGINSDVIELSDTHAIVLRVIELREAQLKPLIEVRAQVNEDIKHERAQQQIKKRSEEVLARLREGDDEAAIATQYQLEWTRKEGIKKDDLDVNRAILRAAFDMSKPEQGAGYKRITIGVNDYAVIALTDVEQIDDEQLDNIVKQKKGALYADLLRDHIYNEWGRLLGDIRKQSSIEIYDDNIRPY